MSKTLMPIAGGLKREDLMLMATEYNDLCTTCNHVADCLQRATLRRPVWFCEEFDCFEPAPKKAAPKSTARRSPSNPSGEDAAAFGGICRNCEDRHACLLTKQGEVRWHCEEYV